jgi:hypothetical protein
MLEVTTPLNQIVLQLESLQTGRTAKDYTMVLTRLVKSLQKLGYLQTVKTEGLTVGYLRGVKVAAIIKEALGNALGKKDERTAVVAAIKDTPAGKNAKKGGKGGLMFDKGALLEADEGNSAGNGRLVDRTALLAHALCDPECQEVLKKIQEGPSNSSSSAMQDAGATAVRQGWWNELARIAMKNKDNYANTFTDECLLDIDPSKGVIADGATFKSLKTEMMNKYNTLLLSTQTTGSNHSGAELDDWVFQNRLGSSVRCKDLALFYVWKYLNLHRQDLTVVSTACPPGVGGSAGFGGSSSLLSPSGAQITTNSSSTTTTTSNTRKEKEKAKKQENMKEMVGMLGAILPAVMVGGSQQSLLDSSEKKKNNAMASSSQAQAGFYTAKTETEMQNKEDLKKNAGIKRLQDTLSNKDVMEHVTPNSKKQMVAKLVELTTGN